MALAKEKEVGIREHYPVIYRVNHGGEGLGIVRYISSLFTSSRFNRYDVDFQITEKKAVSGHAMKLISCRLADEVAIFGEGVFAEHYYGKEFINKYMIDRPVVEGEKKDPVCRVAKDT